MTKSLIQRLEEASEGSRELDADVADATVGFMEWDGRPVTTSLDAAIALAERVLPGEQWVILSKAMRAVSDSHKRMVSGITAQEITLQCCIAILKAKESHNV